MVEGLELNDSQWASEENVVKVLNHINPVRIRYLNFKNCNKLSDGSIKLIVEVCVNIEAISLINCTNVSEKGIQAIVENCSKLRTFVLVYDGSKCQAHWPFTNNIFQILMYAGRSKIENLAIVGFENLGENGYLSLIDHFSSTLISFDFGGSKLKNSSIQKISEYNFINNIQSLALSNTEISIDEVNSFSSRFSTLRCIDLSRCININDEAVITLSKSFPLLEIINLNFCSSVGSASLEALCQNCMKLKKIKLRQTGVQRVPFTLKNLTGLIELNLLQCNLEFPPAIFVENGLKEIFEFFDECDLGNRRKIMLLGPSKCGKSSLLASLKRMKPVKVDTRSYGISIARWKPEIDTKIFNLGGKSPDFEVWDCSGGQELLGCHEVFMTKGNLFLLIFNVSKEDDCKEVKVLYETIQAKCADANVILIGTHIDHCHDEAVMENDCNVILEQIKQSHEEYIDRIRAEIDTLSKLKTDAGMTGYRLRELRQLLTQRIQNPNKIFRVSCITGQGFDELTDEIIRTFSDYEYFPRFLINIPDRLYEVYGIVLAIRKASTIFVTESHFRDLLLRKEIPDIEESLRFLEAIGAILKVSLPGLIDDGEIQQICINPPIFARMVVSIHCDNLSAQRLLSQDLPDKLFADDEQKVVNSLKSKIASEVMTIPREGVILESLIPYLFNEFTEAGEIQISRFMRVMLDQGLLAEGASDGLGLSISNYPRLSKTKRYYIPLLRLLPSTPQEEIWSPEALPEIDSNTVQIGWTLELYSPTSPDLITRTIARCRNCVLNVIVLQHWLYGIQLRRDDIEVQYYARCQTCLRNNVECGCKFLISELYEAQSLGKVVCCKVTETEINADLLFPPQGTMKDGMNKLGQWLRSMADAKRRYNREHKPSFTILPNSDDDDSEDKNEISNEQEEDPVSVSEIDMKKIKFTAAEAVTRILARATISYLADPEDTGSPSAKVMSIAQGFLNDACMGSAADAIACLSSSNPWSAKWAMEDASRNLVQVVSPYVNWKSIARMKNKPIDNKTALDSKGQVTCSALCNIQ
ncbi:uncharacterized protein TRIADDRAFT_52407 [Trichoplax adhaerens]|uniref:Roc domain-containing protein n=1 Tax=Trichoplax adhaerens TaxID=10228 RepID=B3RIA7_TRIAD|nr:hypothetical protein TRIADDRAFT_52407 [Trichoplax adhaerens]EDV28986.1 hypothetical protein TRIADDRAFT_52407 [Trichoplax adhaerens]|eukprot:XP_002108188.1 hypothetical protein TRIADDRAFT_52407 [Trichoplax adhaerens]